MRKLLALTLLALALAGGGVAMRIVMEPSAIAEPPGN